ncbi:hypothetical protein G6F59_018736 [Rhizopus arrhizus]|nr:hypothetical protein G6F24_018942 [Rhizopus arrhizus]KAG1369156.1 hypothetical protein G6F59_018736 [Rhizopus arrhizus]
MWPISGTRPWPASSAQAKHLRRTCARRWTVSPRPSNNARPRCWTASPRAWKRRRATCPTPGLPRCRGKSASAKSWPATTCKP